MDTPRTDYDLAVTLATALRDAHAAGDAEQELSLAVTLEATAVRIAQQHPGWESMAPGPTHMNNRVDAGLVARLLAR